MSDTRLREAERLFSVEPTDENKKNLARVCAAQGHTFGGLRFAKNRTSWDHQIFSIWKMCKICRAKYEEKRLWSHECHVDLWFE